MTSYGISFAIITPLYQKYKREYSKKQPLQGAQKAVKQGFFPYFAAAFADT